MVRYDIRFRYDGYTGYDTRNNITNHLNIILYG